MADIVIDARKYFDFGIGTYVRNLVDHLAPLSSPHSFHLLISDEDRPRIIPPRGWKMHPVSYPKYSIGELMFLGGKVKSLSGTAILHSPHYTLPFGLRNRAVVTIHDLIHLRFPNIFSISQRTYARLTMSRALQEAQFVVTCSEFTKNDILRSFSVDKEKIIPIHLGVAPHFKHVSSVRKKSFRQQYKIDKPYILFVGNTKPHKGLSTLLASFKSIASEFPDVDLALVGGKPDQAIMTAVSSTRAIAKRVRILGHLPEGSLVDAYNAAEVLVLPSLYEGFGLPVLEAMACGTPVVASNAASLPEIVQDAGLLFEAGNSNSLSDTIILLFGDSRLRRTLTEKGKKRGQSFSWQTTAEKTFSLYNRLISKRESL